jgi:hypothetical protein
MSEELFGRVFFIIYYADQFAAADLFLSERGWTIQSGRTIKDCITAIASDPPDFVFVSADHPQVVSTNVPKLIREALGIPVIGFSEVGTPESFTVLDGMAVEYKMNQKPSGMAFERMILNVRHLVQLRKSRIDAEFTKYDENGGPDFQIIKGLKREKDQVMKFDGIKPSKEFNIVQKGPQADRFKIVQEGPKSKEFEFKREGPPTAPEFEVHTGTNEAPVGKKPKKTSVLSEAVSETFKLIIAHEDLESPETIAISSTLFALTIQTENFNGVLLLAMGKDLEPEAKFLTSFSQFLNENLLKRGETLKSSQMNAVNVNPVAFLDWTDSHAEFVELTTHLSYEVAVAFFPVARERDITPYEVVDQKDKIRININDLKLGVPVDFDLYIYLSSNDKFLLYTAKNYMLYENQIQRLKEKGVHYLFIDRKNEALLKRYLLQNHVNDLIADFNSGKKSAA